MLSGRKVSKEPWEGDLESKKENFVQEELYIHGKLLIADDRTIICGSANINDRDSNMIDSTMHGKPYKASQLAATLRRKIWRKHLGLLPPQNINASNDPGAQPPGDCQWDCTDDNIKGPENDFVTDPLSDELWDT
ncbi:uncharacterized protein CDV56_107042 [Aspergillus thermomutatus]|uniref:phospholipase D n=1 Tax=Aspergillus thermomutatus TaxID=41047 RepID=A0A397HGB2_ASPTH|nr:uncharacterized protein CDV56_107042 [Aspergillus thermomutatus]RHZ62007.1 hypothetical protein CDV56_107042 [Aspergillus thermomutatus]